MSDFERVNDSLASGTSLIRHRATTAFNAPIGDFLSRIWMLYGNPTAIGYEGFSYTFRDKETGLVFTAYAAGSGPAYGGNSEDALQLKAILDRFDTMLDEAANADCEIEVDTDFGILTTGAKDGIPFDTIEEE